MEAFESNSVSTTSYLRILSKAHRRETEVIFYSCKVNLGKILEIKRRVAGGVDENYELLKTEEGR